MRIGKSEKQRRYAHWQRRFLLWSEYRAATEDAYEGGALYVSNALKIK